MERIFPFGAKLLKNPNILTLHSIFFLKKANEPSDSL